MVYRLRAKPDRRPPPPFVDRMTQEINDTRRREISTAPRPVEPEGFEGRPSRGHRSNASTGVFVKQ